MAAVAASVTANSANVAYKKSQAETRLAIKHGRNQPRWLREIALRSTAREGGDDQDGHGLEGGAPAFEPRFERTRDRKARGSMGPSAALYDRIAGGVFDVVTRRKWFETIIVVCLCLSTVATVVDLENRSGDEGSAAFVRYSSIATLALFTVECVLKLVAEGRTPLNYFTDDCDGLFNCFDFSINILSYACLLGGSSFPATQGFRLLRLLRLLTFIKWVPELRVILGGIAAGLRSVSYIATLLVLVLYIYAILGCMFFGNNDAARWGTVPVAMLTLFVVTCNSGWPIVAYTSWFGCETFVGGSQPAHAGAALVTDGGVFPSFQCHDDIGQPVFTWFYFTSFIVLTTWVIASLFVGVISQGTFEAYNERATEKRNARYFARLEEFGVSSATSGITKEGRDWFSEPRERFEHLAEEDMTKPQRLRVAADRALVDVLPEDKRLVLRSLAHAGGERGEVAQLCADVAESAWFNLTVATVVIVLAVMVGVDTERALSCARFELRHTADLEGKTTANCNVTSSSQIINYAALTIFTVEIAVKVGSYGKRPKQYFSNHWNQLDFFIVVMGFLELSPLASLDGVVSVVFFRLLRLLRVCRVAQALPRLQSIVEALVASFSSVGWVCLLIATFNFVVGCLCLMLFSGNDPFHFGSLARATFTVLRIDSGASWERVMFINMYGCDEFGYSVNGSNALLLEGAAGGGCNHPHAFGWIAAGVFVPICVFGRWVLPTTLIGIVVISFKDAEASARRRDSQAAKAAARVEKAQSSLPNFFTGNRIALMRACFDLLDVDHNGSLDVVEILPLFAYLVWAVLEVRFTKADEEHVFQLMDKNGDGLLGFAEFVDFLVVVKEVAVEYAGAKKASLSEVDSTWAGYYANTMDLIGAGVEKVKEAKNKVAGSGIISNILHAVVPQKKPVVFTSVRARALSLSKVPPKGSTKTAATSKGAKGSAEAPQKKKGRGHVESI